MKLLLDENIPKVLRLSLKGHEISTVEEEGWRSVKNGELLHRMIAAGFDALITLDRQLQYQQNFTRYPIPVIVLKLQDREKKLIREFAPSINKLLKRRLKPGPHELTLN